MHTRLNGSQICETLERTSLPHLLHCVFLQLVSGEIGQNHQVAEHAPFVLSPKAPPSPPALGSIPGLSDEQQLGLQRQDQGQALSWLVLPCSDPRHSANPLGPDGWRDHPNPASSCVCQEISWFVSKYRVVGCWACPLLPRVSICWMIYPLRMDVYFLFQTHMYGPPAFPGQAQLVSNFRTPLSNPSLPLALFYPFSPQGVSGKIKSFFFFFGPIHLLLPDITWEWRFPLACKPWCLVSCLWQSPVGVHQN